MSNVLEKPVIVQQNLNVLALTSDRSIDPEGSPRSYIVTPDVNGWTIFLPGVTGNSNVKETIEGDDAWFYNDTSGVGGFTFLVAITGAAIVVPIGDYLHCGFTDISAAGAPADLAWVVLATGTRGL